MKKKRNMILTIGIYLCGMFICTNTIFVVQAFAEEILLVCNKSVPVESLDKKQVRAIFLGKEIEWENKDKIVITILKIKKLHKIFLDKYVGMTPSKYRTYWKQMVFTGKRSSTPEVLETEEQLIEYVAKTDGAIGYVSSNVNTDTVRVISDKADK